MNLPGINYEEALERMVGNQDLLLRVLHAIVADIHSSADDFAAFISKNQFEQAYKTAHRTKGLAANSSAIALFELLDDCCRACIDKEAETALASFQEALAESQKLKEALPG